MSEHLNFDPGLCFHCKNQLPCTWELVVIKPGVLRWFCFEVIYQREQRFTKKNKAGNINFLSQRQIMRQRNSKCMKSELLHRDYDFKVKSNKALTDFPDT